MPTDTTSNKPAPRSDGIRETLDSIIVAFILAFVFRAFVAEAFIIPTGSMAPSLYGKHAAHRCSNCRYEFSFGVDASQDVVRNPIGVTCPNCSQRDVVGTSADMKLADSGDRILVLKWPYDIGGSLLGPRRWSVVVFKNPLDGKQNYIKRLVGMPDEVLEIIDGDIYAAPAATVPEAIRQKLLADPLTTRDRGLTDADERTLAKLLTIQRKPDADQEALWMLHYDNDFPPENPLMDGARWESGGPPDQTGWDASTPRVVFDGRDDREHVLELTGKPIADFYAYNPMKASLDNRYVGDVRLRFVLTPEKESGQLSLLLTKNADKFRAILKPDGTVTLEHAVGDSPWRMLASGKTDPLTPGRERIIDFRNLEYRVSLRVDDHVAVATNDEQYKPDVVALTMKRQADGSNTPTRISIGARGMPLRIQHLSVHRDVYYRSVPSEYVPGNPYQSAGVMAWGTMHNPIYLRSGDYFMCGDNSPASKDSRLWWENGDFVQRRGEAYQRGTVPADQLIGEAFFVYWPAGRRLGDQGLPVIPNVGRMRPIR